MLTLLIPVRDFATAKQRLRPTLSDRECAGLAEAMLCDVMDTMRGVRGVDEHALVGGRDARRLAARLHWRWIDDGGIDRPNRILADAATELAARGIDSALIMPGDLPLVSRASIAALLAAHEGGLSLCPAARDGGTNALLVTPPNAIEFCFGTDSARRHLEAGIAAGLKVRRVPLRALERDIDTPADLRALCAAGPGGHTGAFLKSSGIAARLCNELPRAAGQEG